MERWTHRKRTGDGRWVIKLLGQVGCVKVSLCVWVTGCNTGRKHKQPVQFAHLITSARERESETDRQGESEADKK